MFELSQSFSDISSPPILVGLLNVFMKTVNEFYMLTCLNGCAFVYELSGCGMDFCYSNLNFRCCVCWAPWGKRELLHIQTITETTFTLKRVCDMVRTGCWKISCCSTQFYQILSFTAKIMHLRFSMVEQLQSRLAKIGSNSCLSSYFIR